MEDTPPMILLRQITKHYGHPDQGTLTPVLQGIDLEVASGESLAIIGESGSGKSTLLNILGALDHADAGTVQVAGKDLTQLSALELAQFRNQTVGFVFQAHHLLPQCTVLENVLLPTLASPSPVDATAVEARARHLLERVGLTPRINHKPGQLSGGERQRAAVVRALINQPQLLLADEPTGALDRASSENLTDILVALNKEEGTTLIVVTHSLTLADKLDRAMELRDGHLRPASPSTSATSEGQCS